MKPENPIYVKFELQEALNSKKDLISSEIILLKISQAMSNYNLYRQKELSNKLKILKKIQELKEDIDTIQKNMPKPKVPRAIEKEEGEIIKIKEIKHPASTDLEKQLEEIQKRLMEFQAK